MSKEDGDVELSETPSVLSSSVLSTSIRAKILEDYRIKHKEAKEKRKRHEKRVIIETVRKRPTTARLHHSKVEHEKSNEQGYFHGLKHYFQRKDILEHPDGWAAARIYRAMVRLRFIQHLTGNQLRQYLSKQCKALFEECCKCNPLANGPTISPAGVPQIAGPNIPKILKILKSRENIGMDLLQPHGVAQSTVAHVAVQRGYFELIQLLLTHWSTNPMESPYQSYSLLLLRELLQRLLQLRSVKTLVSESNSEIRDKISQLGVPFPQFCAALDKFRDHAITLEDLINICGHPLVLSKDAVGNTPLHYAAEGGYISICQLLIEKGAKINEQNNAGETPLHFAISSSHQHVCMYLIQMKADVSISRYVMLTLLNGVSIRGGFVDSPPDDAVCKVMPILQSRSNHLIQQHSNTWKFPWQTSKKKGIVTPDPNKNMSGTLPHTGKIVEDTLFSRVDCLAKSVLFRDRNPREIVFFRTAPGNALIKPNLLCVFLIGDHISYSEYIKTRDLQQMGKLFHLLITNLPQVAVAAMDSFRTPLFRCNLVKHIREHNQRWVVDNKIKLGRPHREALLTLLKGHRDLSHRRRPRHIPKYLFLLLRWMKKGWKLVIKIRHFFSVQLVFTAHTRTHKENIICEPKGIVYEYQYDHAEFRGGSSPTFSLVVKTECKELIEHPWFRSLMDHKWNSYARDTFRSEFHIYTLYFLAGFISTLIHVGDTSLGMPVGGYRSIPFHFHSTYVEYIRDGARIIYFIINAYYTYQEYHAYCERGSLRAYFQDGWNWFDLVQFSCVWMLLASNLVECFVPTLVASEDFKLVVFLESYYNVDIRRQYNLRTSLMSIVGPLLWIKWIQFARGNRKLGPFVRMIFKMFRDIFVFLFVFVIFLFGFAFAFFILQLEGCRTYFSSITTLFQISLGAWDWDMVREGGTIAIVFFILYAVIGTIMLLNLLIAMLGNTYDKIWEQRLLFFDLERAKATLSIQTTIDNDIYDERYWCQRLYVLEEDTPIEGIQFQKF